MALIVENTDSFSATGTQLNELLTVVDEGSLVVVVCSIETPNSVTWGGENLTKVVDEQEATSTRRVSIWKLANPSQFGSRYLNINQPSSNEVYAFAIVFSGAEQVALVGASNSGEGTPYTTGGGASVSITTIEDNSIIVGGIMVGTGALGSPSATAIGTEESGSNHEAGASYKSVVSPGGDSIDYAIDVNSNGAMAVVEVIAAASTTTSTTTTTSTSTSSTTTSSSTTLTTTSSSTTSTLSTSSSTTTTITTTSSSTTITTTLSSSTSTTTTVTITSSTTVTPYPSLTFTKEIEHIKGTKEH